MTARINHNLNYHLIKKCFILLGPTFVSCKSLRSEICLALTQGTCASCPTSHTQGHPSTAYLHEPVNACPCPPSAPHIDHPTPAWQAHVLMYYCLQPLGDMPCTPTCKRAVSKARKQALHRPDPEPSYEGPTF
jgi:hypothetical protein